MAINSHKSNSRSKAKRKVTKNLNKLRINSKRMGSRTSKHLPDKRGPKANSMQNNPRVSRKSSR